MVELYAKCPICQKKERHSIISVKSEDKAVCKCENCGGLHYEKISDCDERELKVILSLGGESKQLFKEFNKKRTLNKGEVLEIQDLKVEIREIETCESKRNPQAKVENIRTIWVIPYSKKIKISVHDGEGETKAYKIEKEKDTKLKLGDVIQCGDKKIKISRISTNDGEKEEEIVGDVLGLVGEEVS